MNAKAAVALVVVGGTAAVADAWLSLHAFRAGHGEAYPPVRAVLGVVGTGPGMVLMATAATGVLGLLAGVACHGSRGLARLAGVALIGFVVARVVAVAWNLTIATGTV